ncbi:hypothetical protein [Kitasatospora sp. NPDC057541]|uniref:hypothetical protein n=1 Tax=unclassified Kitasatospora TaxID=2633591 RepID=UPI0036AED42D
MDSEHRQAVLGRQFERYVLAGIPDLQRRGYNPTLFLRMVRQHGAVGAAKRLLASAAGPSAGFTTLWTLGRLDASVEYAVCLPWFRELFSDEEAERAERRLDLHEFPLRRIHEAEPPDWYADL